MQQWQVFLNSLHGPQYGGDVRWSTASGNVVLGLSRMNQRITGGGTFINLFDPSGGYLPFPSTTTAYWTNVFYGEYRVWKLRLDSEYRHDFLDVPYLPGIHAQSDTRAWYVSGSYRIQKRIEIGSYYSHYTLRNEGGPGLAPLLGPSDLSLPRNHIYDKVVAARVDLNRFCYVKIEGHFMDGYGWGTYPNGFYSQQNPLGFKPGTNALVVKTGFHF